MKVRAAMVVLVLGAPVVVRAAPPAAACLAMVEDDPEAARQSAQAAMRRETGDAALRNGTADCLARADAVLGLWTEAAPVFDALSARTASTGGDRQAAAGFALAASDAWRAGGKPAAACASADAGLKLAPDDAAMRLGHARASVGCGAAAAALADLAAPFAGADTARQADVLVLRAQALRLTGAPGPAEAAATAALALKPDWTEALLERGIDRARLGHLRLARQDWERVVALEPDGPDANRAQQDLDVLEADPDRADAAR